jgi:SAM-dependent methyltransferase
MDLRERPDGHFLRHPWETARAAFFVERVASALAARPAARILDVGAGDTWLAAKIARRLPRARIVCWDPAYTAEALAALPAPEPGVERRAAPPEGRFDLLLLLDVLEHVDDDRGFLDSLLADHLEADGRVLASVPAWPSLFGPQDRALSHRRRYSGRGFRALLQSSGLRVLEWGGLFHSLLAVRWLELRRLGEGAPASAGDGGALAWPHGRTSARWAHRLLSLDARLGHIAARWRLGCPGLSCWALCERSR